MTKTFLHARWRNLIMANYPVPPEVLLPYLPAGTQLDDWQGKHYVSLVGFMFTDTRVLGVRIPFHIHFEEVNLRFYVKYKDGEQWKRGVVFISEIVPKPAIAFVANTLFNECYRTCRMRHTEVHRADRLAVSYAWRYKGSTYCMAVEAAAQPVAIAGGSAEDFFTEHYWGYSDAGRGRTTEYAVAHPVWRVHPIHHYKVEADFAHLYGASFAMLNGVEPDSVLLAEGSAVQVGDKRKLP